MTSSNNTFEQAYNAREGDDLSQKVVHVVCLLLPRAIMVAAFGATRDLLAIRYTCYGAGRRVWALDFFEHILLQEPLLAAREKVRGVFLASERNLIVPEAL